MPPRPKLPLAPCLVGLVSLLFYFSSGVRDGLLALLVGLPSLLLAVLLNRGKSGSGVEEESAPRTATPRPADAWRETANGSAPAGALLEATMNGMREGVLVVNNLLRVVSANDAAMSVFG